MITNELDEISIFQCMHRAHCSQAVLSIFFFVSKSAFTFAFLVFKCRQMHFINLTWEIHDTVNTPSKIDEEKNLDGNRRNFRAHARKEPILSNISLININELIISKNTFDFATISIGLCVCMHLKINSCSISLTVVCFFVCASVHGIKCTLHMQCHGRRINVNACRN